MKRFSSTKCHITSTSEWGHCHGPTCKLVAVIATLLCLAGVGRSGPYTEVGIDGYIGDDRRSANPLADADARVNPIFRGWATDFENYLPSDDEWMGDWDDPSKALGPATGDVSDIVSLGDLDAAEISQQKSPGCITLIFGDPCDVDDANHIRNVRGYDFAVFENGFLSIHDTAAGSVWGQMLAELGYVEVSSNGIDFIRFSSVSLTADQVGGYGTIEISDVLNMAGKHPNSYGRCTGTAFDLEELSGHPLVSSGVVDINNISYVRIVDVPGSGDFNDLAVEHVDPCSWPSWSEYDANHGVYDAWVTEGSGGLDLEAVGVLKEQVYSADINLDGIVNSLDFALLGASWQKRFGEVGWIGRCDLDNAKDMMIDGRDLGVFADQWLETEQWRSE
jgi:hypothetical protein